MMYITIHIYPYAHASSVIIEVVIMNVPENKELITKQHELIRKQGKEDFTSSEAEELNEITKQIDENTKNRLAGIVPEPSKTEPRVERAKLSVADRKARALEMIEQMKGKEQKEIIKAIREELGVSYTYVYKFFKAE